MDSTAPTHSSPSTTCKLPSSWIVLYGDTFTLPKGWAASCCCCVWCCCCLAERENSGFGPGARAVLLKLNNEPIMTVASRRICAARRSAASSVPRIPFTVCWIFMDLLRSKASATFAAGSLCSARYASKRRQAFLPMGCRLLGFRKLPVETM